MIKLKDLLLEKKLRVFDFDDTLVKTKAKVYITTGSGKKRVFTPGEWAVYKPNPNDKFDFSEFDGELLEPKQIKPIMKVFNNVVKASGTRKINILTARGNYKPVKKFLTDIGYGGIFVITLNSGNPQKKADWIESQIKKGYDDILFFDDSNKNINAVKALGKKYPSIKLNTRLVKYD